MSSPEQVYISRAGIAQFNVSYEVRCAESFYGGDCVTFCQNFVSCEECGLAGFTGDFCQLNIDDCEDEDCSGNGRCEDGINGFTCVCEAGYTGETCETIDHCFRVNCSGNGVYTNTPDSILCMCEPEYVGEMCQLQQEKGSAIAFSLRISLLASGIRSNFIWGGVGGGVARPLDLRAFLLSWD